MSSSTKKGDIYPTVLSPKGINAIVHPKMRTLLPFTYPQVPNLYKCIFSDEYKESYLKNGKQMTFWDTQKIF